MLCISSTAISRTLRLPKLVLEAPTFEPPHTRIAIGDTLGNLRMAGGEEHQHAHAGLGHSRSTGQVLRALIIELHPVSDLEPFAVDYRATTDALLDAVPPITVVLSLDEFVGKASKRAPCRRVHGFVLPGVGKVKEAFLTDDMGTHNSSSSNKAG